MGFEFSVAATEHARRRIQQRGIASAAVDMVLRNFDRVLHAGDGCQSVRLSRRAVSELQKDGADRQLLERAGRIVVVMREDNLKIVTVLHDHSTDYNYRRQSITRKHSATLRTVK